MPLVDVTTCSPSLLVKNVEHRCLRRPGDAYNGHVGQQENRGRGMQHEMELSKRYPTAFSCAAPLMKRATISSFVAHCQMVFEAAGSHKRGRRNTVTYLPDPKEEHGYVSDGGAESGHVLVAVARIKIEQSLQCDTTFLKFLYHITAEKIFPGATLP